MMIPCPTCHRHSKPGETSCVWCRATTMKRLALVAAGGTMVITLSACYGGPPVQENRARKPPETPTTAPAPSASTPNQ